MTNISCEILIIATPRLYLIIFFIIWWSVLKIHCLSLLSDRDKDENPKLWCLRKRQNLQWFSNTFSIGPVNHSAGFIFFFSQSLEFLKVSSAAGEIT